MIFCEKLAGSPREIGLAHGRAFRHQIAYNVGLLIDEWLPARNPGQSEAARAWALARRRRHYAQWPWMAEEIVGIAEGTGIPCETIELLNFRAWQYHVYGVGGACTSFIGRSADAGLVLGGALDDPRELYGMVEVAPTNGFHFMTFSLLGTVWGNRGVNSAGLAIGISSLPLTGLRGTEEPWQQDLCLRAMLQNCADCAALEAFCRTHAFSLNIMAVDAQGGCLALSRTTLGSFVHPETVSVLANHLPTAALRAQHQAAGWDGKILGRASEQRVAQMTNFLHRRDGVFTLAEAEVELARKDPDGDCGVHNADTCFLALAAPQRRPLNWRVASRPAITFQDFQFTP